MICIEPGYEGFTFAQGENRRNGPLGEVADFRIVGTPANMRSELGCWLTLPTELMANQ